jgi:hypothetical protein
MLRFLQFWKHSFCTASISVIFDLLYCSLNFKIISKQQKIRVTNFDINKKIEQEGARGGALWYTREYEKWGRKLP